MYVYTCTRYTSFLIFYDQYMCIKYKIWGIFIIYIYTYRFVYALLANTDMEKLSLIFLKKLTVRIKYAHIEAANLSLFVKLGCSEYRKNCWMYNYALCLPEVHNIKFFVYI